MTKSEAKTPEFDANTEPVIGTLLLTKSEAETLEFDANTEPVIRILILTKSEAKTPDFDANQSNLLMNVVIIYKYGKRFRYAPSFNYWTKNIT